jgi:hypothetical protein
MSLAAIKATSTMWTVRMWRLMLIADLLLTNRKALTSPGYDDSNAENRLSMRYWTGIARWYRALLSRSTFH